MPKFAEHVDFVEAKDDGNFGEVSSAALGITRGCRIHPSTVIVCVSGATTDVEEVRFVRLHARAMARTLSGVVPVQVRKAR